MIDVICPICEVDDTRFLFEVEGLRLVQCKRCGLIYFNPNVEFKEHVDFLDVDYWVAPTYQRLKSSGKYDYKAYLDHLDAEDIKGYPDYLEPRHLDAKVQWGKRVLGWFKKYYPEAHSVIELGCATGHMLKPFVQAGWSPVVGVEVSPWIVDRGRELNPKLDLRLGNFENMQFTETFDCALLWDVFEHYQYPNGVLKNLYQITSSKMVAICHLPDADQSRGKDWYLWSPRQHCFHYNRKTLGMILDKHGFKIVGEEVSPEAGEMVVVWGKK